MHLKACYLVQKMTWRMKGNVWNLLLWSVNEGYSTLLSHSRNSIDMCRSFSILWIYALDYKE
jgi:hypothetical protein